ncbi:MAG: RsmE family RNA methyltransferase [Gemmatimonadaceae bacterium]
MIGFYSNDAFVAGSPLILGADAAQHLRVLRAGVGERVQLRDGKGGAGEGVISRVGKRSVTVDVAECSMIDAQLPVHLMVPVADRDRMLMLAEKCTELGATSWRPVMWRRSRSVGPLGDGPAFQARIFARMTAALTQSGAGWLPETHPSAPVSRAIAAAPEGSRLLLDAGADVRLGSAPITSPVVIAIGPEGGLESKERDEMVAAGFVPVRIAGSILRFETAGIAALSVVRCLLEREGDHHG